MWNGGYGWGWGWIITAVVIIALFALLITAIVLAVRFFTVADRHGDARSPQQTRGAENMLAERFARGEIDEDDYRRRMAALSEHY
jgi:putative membrane protein